MINSAACFLGLPLDFKGQFKVYPPKIKDVLNNSDFQKFFSLFTISQEDIEDQIFNMNDDVKIQEGQIPTPYQYMVQICLANQEYLNLIKDGFKFFTNEELTFIAEKQMFLIGNLEDILQNVNTLDDLPIFKPEDYFEFQNMIRAAMGDKELEPYDYNMHPRKRQMLAKARYRDRIKAKQNAKSTSFLNNLASICCMGIGLTPLNIGEMTYAAINILISKFQFKEKYDLDIQSLLAGADKKKVKPKYWMSEEKE